jgi:hypothetical protein
MQSIGLAHRGNKIFAVFVVQDAGRAAEDLMSGLSCHGQHPIMTVKQQGHETLEHLSKFAFPFS